MNRFIYYFAISLFGILGYLQITESEQAPPRETRLLQIEPVQAGPPTSSVSLTPAKEQANAEVDEGLVPSNIIYLPSPPGIEEEAEELRKNRTSYDDY